ncbi:UxaA family hydrolase [Desulfocurvus sp. DL9XJH121]
MKAIVVIGEADNVGNAIEDICTGESVVYTLNGKTQELKAMGDVPFGFKMAIKDIAVDAPVVKYGEVIGVASKPISAGECVHIHNVAGNRGRGDLKGAK